MADAVFLALSVITIGSAIAALELRSLIYGSIALMGTLGGIAGFFLLLDSPFVAMFQLAVYVGSIAVLILFTVMLVKRELIFKKVEDKRRKFVGIALMLVFMVALGSIIMEPSATIKTSISAIPTNFLLLSSTFLKMSSLFTSITVNKIKTAIEPTYTASWNIATNGESKSKKNPAIPPRVPIKAIEP